MFPSFGLVEKENCFMYSVNILSNSKIRIDERRWNDVESSLYLKQILRILEPAWYVCSNVNNSWKLAKNSVLRLNVARYKSLDSSNGLTNQYEHFLQRRVS